MVEFIKGKWYGNHPNWSGFYIKCNNFDGICIHSEEQIHSFSNYRTKKQKYQSSLDGYKQINVSEIAHLLPKGHPDLIPQLQNIEIY